MRRDGADRSVGISEREIHEERVTAGLLDELQAVLRWRSVARSGFGRGRFELSGEAVLFGTVIAEMPLAAREGFVAGLAQCLGDGHFVQR